MQMARADVGLDVNPSREAVELALGRLEAVARARGFATVRRVSTAAFYRRVRFQSRPKGKGATWA
jgi:polysaccharide deacetylase 2 family uncharacterized protein YibQ